MQIAEHCVASFHYTLTNHAGEVLDSSEGREPLAYLHGAGNLIPGMEKALAGRAAGDKFEATIEPEDGYGQHDERLVQVVQKSAFGDAEVKPGMRFEAQSNAGPMVVTVTAVAEDEVTVDGNHALAGEVLNFKVEVVEVRQASDEEKTHGHVHGPGGHAH